MGKEKETTGESQEKKEPRLTKKQIDDITEIATRVGVRCFEEQRIAYYKLLRDKKRHNTKLLIRKYKLLKEYSNNAVYDNLANVDWDGETILSIMGVDIGERRKVQSIQNGVIVTSIIMDHVDTMLECYKQKCLKSTKQEVGRRWRELYNMYLAEECMPAQEVADLENVSVSMIYQDLDIVYDELSSMFFGIDLVEFF